jgi:acyl-CoA reductase-like NAD-dependent aldehyde dehydrogenase
MTSRLPKAEILSPVTGNAGQCCASRFSALVEQVRLWKTVYERFGQACRRHVVDLPFSAQTGTRMR